MSNPTKGPWQHGHMMDGENVWIGPDCKAIPVAYVDRDPQRARDEWEANARLIAAAPDLLEALEGLLPWLEAAETKCLVGHEGCVWAVEQVRAAIANASQSGDAA